ncbi:hypothetical protein C9F11_43065 (plasmid) [Streptomyces sp. YIM 121038]|uniref:hypothetical protein n=1 Tax=Streptomyces sp. YIM 121038 TaxID=2136401 RepID=UPI00111025E3|nr:hypothetical protein [Streptomyces sp. YIM 121038]QCX82193.1 hypothetical protein C9F11_43065 [Streptomyces sp. YIM 121038]
MTVVSVPSPRRLTEKEQIFHDGLTEHLLWALPIAMLELLSRPSCALEQQRKASAAAVGGRGDAIQFHSKKRTAEAGQQLDLGLAYLAISTPGGITRFGVHACAAPHDNCPADAGSPNQLESTT